MQQDNKQQQQQQQTHLTALCLGLPGWSSTRKVKPILILLKQETVGGSGISWGDALLSPNQQCQSTEGNATRQLFNYPSLGDKLKYSRSLKWR